MEPFAVRLAEVQSEIAAAAARAGRAPQEIALLAISKTHPPEAVREALEAGQFLFGESRVQEARAKIPACPPAARWHLVGHLQKNKIRHALPLFELIHGVDSLQIARDIQRIAAEDGHRPRVLLEVNIAGEGGKFGFSPSGLKEQMEMLLGLDRLQIEGLMTIPPPAAEPEASRKMFEAVRNLRDRLQEEFRVGLPELSMGMSGDYPAAIEAGATMVRVGTALFGGRTGKTWRPPGDPGEN